jgi:hypothetical protein
VRDSKGRGLSRPQRRVASEAPSGELSIPRPVHAGQAVYSLPLLCFWYDLSVFGFNNPAVWKCPTRELIEHYRAHVCGNHLEAGVGTGFLLDRCGFPIETSRLVLVDLKSEPAAATN